MKITLPLPPNLANSRMHWRAKHRKRTEYFEACSVAAIVSGFFKQFRGGMPDKIKVSATVFCGGRMDQDNAIARLKWPIDWMVKNDILENDDPAHLEWHWPIEQVVSRKQTYRVEFELEAA